VSDNPQHSTSPVRHSLLSIRNVLAISALEEQALARRTRAERLADFVALRAGSLRSVSAHFIFFGGWILWNSARFTSAFRFDRPPYPALSTVVSLEAIFLSLFILMSQNRSNRRAEERAHLDLQVNLLAEDEATKMLHMLRALCAAHHLPEATDPEVTDFLQRTDPALLAEQLERELPSNGPIRVEPRPETTDPPPPDSRGSA